MDQTEQAVDVISLFSSDGEIRPLRLRVEQQDHQLLRVDIDQIVSRRTVPYVGVEAQIFLCKASVFGRPWLFELKYSIRSHDWTISRILYA